jgi:hypothetical protein
MGKTIMIALAVIIAAAAVFLFIVTRGPDLKQYSKFAEPQIIKMENKKMLALELKGDPNEQAMKAYPKLFSVYFKLKGASMKTAPLARWTGTDTSPASEWVGTYALPMPDSITQLPEQTEQPAVAVEEWIYGDVAQILHIGSYDQETADIKKLRDFITASGYKIAGPHEEEYIKGPGAIFKGNPDKYWTLIRYQVQKK